MRKIDDGDGLRDYNLADLVLEFETDVNYLDRHDIDQAEWELITNQYAYIKFGLLLEKIRNQTWWKKCNVQKNFLTFAPFVRRKLT
jgi:hypothetical protein